MPPKRLGKRATFILDSKIIAQLIFTVNQFYFYLIRIHFLIDRNNII